MILLERVNLHPRRTLAWLPLLAMRRKYLKILEPASGLEPPTCGLRIRRWGLLK